MYAQKALTDSSLLQYHDATDVFDAVAEFRAQFEWLYTQFVERADSETHKHQ